jgi:ion channel-forming bestrophin family protein
VVYGCVYKFHIRPLGGYWEIFFSFVLNSTLSFLLVFRLNRAATRFWIARQYWGDVVAQTRSLVGGILVHGNHCPVHQGNAIRWTAAFSLCMVELLRGQETLPVLNFAGILTKEQVHLLQQQSHPPLYAADRVRYHLKQMLLVDPETSPALAMAWSQQLDRLEGQLNVIIWSGGGLERIKSTPLPIVYVSHLRTFILINLFLFPWVFGPHWGWSTIPIVALSAFAWLGIESAAVEVESPFHQKRVNALDMNAFVLSLLSTIQQQVQNDADQTLLTRIQQFVA